jgi:hypothetical protein
MIGLAWGCRVAQAKMDTPQNLPRIRNEIQALEAKAKQTRFRKDIDIRTFAYHVG